MVAQNIFFGVIAAAMVIAALRLVTTQNVVRAALCLVIVLAGAAAQFILLGAEFVAVTQVLVYIGAIVVLLLFGVMLTRAPIGRDGELDNEQRPIAAAVGLFLFGALGSMLWGAFGDHEVEIAGSTHGNSAAVSDQIFGPNVLAFELVSILLLAALVGAIVIARRD